jgi:hypothetical protein
MKSLLIFSVSLIVLMQCSCTGKQKLKGLINSSNNSSIYKIAFGSCSKQTKPQKILDTVLLYKPNLFIYLGDNIYGDTRDMDVL